MARAIGLGYPGGPKIDKLAKEGNPEAIEFPRAKIGENPYDFSFSGVKSAVLNYLNGAKMKGEEVNRADIAASFRKRLLMYWWSIPCRQQLIMAWKKLRLQAEWLLTGSSCSYGEGMCGSRLQVLPSVTDLLYR